MDLHWIHECLTYVGIIYACIRIFRWGLFRNVVELSLHGSFLLLIFIQDFMVVKARKDTSDGEDTKYFTADEVRRNNGSTG